MHTSATRRLPQQQPQSGSDDDPVRNGARKSPARRRILRKDRRQTLEVLTSDDEVNEFVEARASSYIEPVMRQRLHEVKPHLRSSFETLYNPQFDAPGASNEQWRGSQDSLDDSPLSDEPAMNYDAMDGKPTNANNSNFQRSAPVHHDGASDSSISEGNEAQITPLSAEALEEMNHLADEILRNRQQHQQQQKRPQSPPQTEFTDIVDGVQVGPPQATIGKFNLAIPGGKEPAWNYGIIAGDTDTGGGGGGSEFNRPPEDSMLLSPISPSSDIAYGKRSLPRKTVAFRLPAEEETLARLREAVVSRSQESQELLLGHPHQQVSRERPVRADWRLGFVAGTQPPPQSSLPQRAIIFPLEADRPQQPSVAQQLRTLLPSSGPEAGLFAARQNQLSPSASSALSSQHSIALGSAASLTVDKHTPRRSGSLSRTGSQNFGRQQPRDALTLSQQHQQQQQQQLQNAPLQQLPFKRSWSLQQQHNYQRQVLAYQQSHQEKLEKLEYQKQQQLQLENQKQQQLQLEYQKQQQLQLEYQKQQQLQLEYQKQQQLQLEYQKQQQLQLEYQKQQQRQEQLPLNQRKPEATNESKRAPSSPPRVPPRRKAKAERTAVDEQPEEVSQDSAGAFYSVRQKQQTERSGAGASRSHQGVGDFPWIDHVYKQIHLSAREAQRHQLMVASSHYRLARHISNASRTSLDKHKPLRLSSQSNVVS